MEYIKREKHVSVDFGKVPPQAIELEEAVLGGVMIESNSLISVIDILKPDVFYKENHKIIFECILSLFNKSEQVDMLTVINELKSIDKLDEIGGVYYLSTLTDQIRADVKIEYYARIILQKYYQREVIRVSSSAIDSAYDDTTDVFDLISNLDLELSKINQVNVQSIHHIEDCVKGVLDVMQKNSNGEFSGVPSGFGDLDKFTLGEQKGDLVIIAGETSQGKTAFALKKALNQALLGYKVAIFSYEMSRNQITARLMALSIRISSKKLLMDKLSDNEWNEFNSKINQLIKTNIYIVEVLENSFDWLRMQIKTIVSKFSIDVIYIDYIQLIKRQGMSRKDEVGSIANELKYLAKHPSIDIPINCLCQLKRDQNNPKPELWRLKESGDIENAADTVQGIWRPYFYNIPNVNIRVNDGHYQNINTDGIAILHGLKGRSIGIKDFIFNFNPSLTEFTEYKPGESPF